MVEMKEGLSRHDYNRVRGGEKRAFEALTKGKEDILCRRGRGPITGGSRGGDTLTSLL